VDAQQLEAADSQLERVRGALPEGVPRIQQRRREIQASIHRSRALPPDTAFYGAKKRVEPLG
jgi:hypothetical protein